ncbi:hypothetical protein L484_019899 [Morus notabilis]|uniref:Uncharacterized protein n=1 Tax=Morus notabilis TaxID=981085 RepID=W9SA13_9ROSA|nr:hypothetical protein L484_019899 [Morus notabilis]
MSNLKGSNTGYNFSVKRRPSLLNTSPDNNRFSTMIPNTEARPATLLGVGVFFPNNWYHSYGED